MNNFEFLYEFNIKNGEKVLCQNIAGTRIGTLIEHIARTLNEFEMQHGKNNIDLKIITAKINESITITDKTKLESLTTLVTMGTEHYNQKSGKLVVETRYSNNKDPLTENLKKVLSSPKKRKKLLAELELPTLEVGDTLLIGKFKNKKAEITGFDTDEKGQPIAQTNKGDQKIFKARIAKLIPDLKPTENSSTEEEK